MEAATMVLIDTQSLRSARETLWYGSASIYGSSESVDPITGITTVVENALLYSDVPCKLSHTKIQSNEQTNGPSRLNHAIKVSIGNELNIPAGSKLVITQSGKTETYKASGEPAYFIVHQEIPLIIDGKYA